MARKQQQTGKECVKSPSKQKGDLPVVTLLKVRDITMTQLHLECDEKTIAMFAKIGRETATQEELFELGFRHCLLETLEQKKRQQKKRPTRAPALR